LISEASAGFPPTILTTVLRAVSTDTDAPVPIALDSICSYGGYGKGVTAIGLSIMSQLSKSNDDME
jgi:hypothetical protein